MTNRNHSKPHYENPRSTAEYILEPYTTGRDTTLGYIRYVLTQCGVPRAEAYYNVLDALDYNEMRYKKLIIRNVPDRVLARYIEEREVLMMAAREYERGRM